MTMLTHAFEVAAMLKPLDDQELEGLGATQDDRGIWNFSDGSRLRAAYKPLPTFANSDMTGYLGRSYFDILDWTEDLQLVRYDFILGGVEDRATVKWWPAAIDRGS
jgi:hypothetical protein